MILADCIEICNDIELLNILSIFKSLIGLITIIVPVILVIFVMIDIIKSISSGDVNTKKLFGSVSKRIIAAVVVFLVFPILNTVLQILPISNLYYISCYNCASKDNVLQISVNNADSALANLEQAILLAQSNVNENTYNEAYKLHEEARQHIKEITDKNIREQYQNKLESFRDVLEEIRDKIKE